MMKKMARKTKEEIDEISKSILKLISEDLLSLRAAAKINDISPNTFLRWKNKDEDLAVQYARAIDRRTDGQVEEIIEIADNSTPESVHCDRLRIDARKWTASKMKPKKYGDKLDLTSGGDKIKSTVADMFPKEWELDEQ